MRTWAADASLTVASPWLAQLACALARRFPKYCWDCGAGNLAKPGLGLEMQYSGKKVPPGRHLKKGLCFAAKTWSWLRRRCGLESRISGQAGATGGKQRFASGRQTSFIEVFPGSQGISLPCRRRSKSGNSIRPRDDAPAARTQALGGSIKKFQVDIILTPRGHCGHGRPRPGAHGAGAPMQAAAWRCSRSTARAGSSQPEP